MGLWSKNCENIAMFFFQILDISSDDFSKAVEKVKSRLGEKLFEKLFQSSYSEVMDWQIQILDEVDKRYRGEKPDTVDPSPQSNSTILCKAKSADSETENIDRLLELAMNTSSCATASSPLNYFVSEVYPTDDALVSQIDKLICIMKASGIIFE